MSRQTILLSTLGAVALIAVWWMFLYAPGQERIVAVEQEVAAAEAEGVNLQTRIARLQAVRAAAPETEAAIANLRGIVPTDPALAGVLRQLEAAAQDAGLEVTSLGATRPQQLVETSELHALTLSIVAEGSFFQVVDYLRRLEDPTVTTRGIIVSDVSLVAAAYPTLTVTINGQIFAELPPVPEPPVPGAEVEVEVEAPAEEPAEADAEDAA